MSSTNASGALITSVLFVALGCVVVYSQSYSKMLAALPYTVILFVIGISLNLIDINGGSNVVKNSIKSIGERPYPLTQ